MSRKQTHSFAMVDVSNATSSIQSATTNISQVDKLSIHCKFSAANSGEFKVFVRNSPKDSFFELDFAQTLTITSESECLIKLSELYFTDLYITWTPSAGSGTLTATLHMASIGA